MKTKTETKNKRKIETKTKKQETTEKLVKELYEKYPYPSRDFFSKERAKNYVKWVSKIFGKTVDFWKGKQILELGCGTGELAIGLSLSGANVTAIDFSKTSIKKAKQNAKNLGAKVNFLEKNILETNLNKKFDVVIALGSLHHTINAKKGFEIGVNHLKNEGTIIVGLYNKYSRARHRVKRIILRLIAGNNIEKRIEVGEKLFKGNKSKAWLADKYGQVHESYHSINEINQWFKEQKIKFIASNPKYKYPIIDEIKWLIFRKNAFFVMIGKNDAAHSPPN
ncbi:MAG: class I SAM-dependent methyltransferase [Candidatus Diapherotrites archaeon]|jgi:2-polyprenyl-3-methyl-5-hydroxy-6-metoxy-1,4-benzoquinol methylase|uniref:Class I SAM-dependent methyltransferase n=1 Tax=Candidatus Iainarchaeum sp. TaxID=3101447 RepID=A0A7K4BZ18_9ARCH|nr:class I SAM-dependent methyltransferase [Candidatus Diapherotrites archaeon]